MGYPAQSLTKPLIVPEWDSGNIFLYTPDTAAATLGSAKVNPNYTVNVQTILNNLGSGLLPNPNACALFGPDLYFTNNSPNSQGIFKLPGYLGNPAQAVQNAFVLDLQGSDYIGLAFDPAGNLYASVAFGDGPHQITRYAGAGSATGPVAGVQLGDALSGQAKFGDLAVDAQGNLWAADYGNNRLVVFAAAALADPGPDNAWVALANGTGGAFPVINPFTAVEPVTAAWLLVGPEGLDFDGFGAGASLWVGNNNDGGTGIGQNQWTSLVEITPTLQAKLVALLASNPGTTLAATTLAAGTDFNIFQVPNYTGAKPQFGGVQVDRAAGRLYVNDEVGGWVRGYDLGTLADTQNTPADTDSQVAPNHITDERGNGGIALVQLGCYVQDEASDGGVEPDTATDTAPNVPWESPGIVATIFDMPDQLTLPVPYADPDPGLGADGSDTVLGNATRQIYVQVNYTGAMPTTGLEQLQLYWGKASATLNWPAPWDGSETDSGTGAKLGGPIGSPITIPSIVGTPPGQTPPPFIAGPVAWQTPDPTDYTVQDGHFCLLARIVTPNGFYAENTAGDPSLPGDTSIGAFAGMTVPEGSNLLDNVVANARIAWRNIHIVATEPPGGTAIRLPPGVVATNFGRTPLHLRFAFTLLDERRRIIREPGGQLLVSATGSSLALLQRSSLQSLPHVDARRPNHRRARVPHLATGIDRLRLEPRAMLVFHVDYEPPAGLLHYAIRASAFAQQAGGERLIGGQTFVYGRVEGLSVSPGHKRR
jgi:hypothetical protein